MSTNKEYYFGEEASQKCNELEKVKTDSANWCTYYIDKENNDKYVKVYLESHLHGGGPPRLIRISDFPFR